MKRALGRFATRRAWLASGGGPALAERLARHLGRVRRHEPRGTPPPTPGRDWLLAVHWNVLHGARYERILGALRSEPALAGADLVSLNETDLGLARSGNRDVAFELAEELGLHGAWAPLFLELEAGHKTPPHLAALEQGESLFGLALLSRFPLGRLARVELDSPADLLFDRERRTGSFAALVAEVLDPRGPFHVAVAHLDVHRSPERRLAQVEEILGAVPAGPALLAGDLNTTTFRRGTWGRSARALAVMAAAPGGNLHRRFLSPHLPAGAAREPLFDALRRRGFAIEPMNDASPSLDLRFADVGEVELLAPPLRQAALACLRHVERRAQLRLDWIAARGFVPASERPPFTLTHLMRGPDAASDHAPIGCGLRRS